MINEQIISIEVEDKPGILTRISSLFGRRSFNIKSLTVATTHKPGISRFTLVVQGDDKTLEQIRKQVQKLIHVLTTHQLLYKNSVIREFALLKLDYCLEKREHINHIVDFYGARLIGFAHDSLIVEISGSTEKIEKVFHELQNDYIIESQRTGKIAINKDTV